MKATTSAAALRSLAVLILLTGCRHATPPAPVTIVAVASSDLPACRRTVNVGDDAALAAALDGAAAGDCLLLANGAYRFAIAGKQGQADAPIVVRAARRGGARIESAGLQVRGSAHVVLDG